MNYLSLAVIGSGIAASWNYIKDFLNRFRSLFIVNVLLENEASSAIMYLLWNEFSKSKLGDKRFIGVTKYVNPLKKVQRIAAEKLSKDSVLFWRKKKPLLVTVQCDQWNNYTDAKVTISFLRGMYNIDDLLIEALDKFNLFYSAADDSNKRNRFKIIKLMGKEQIYNIGSNNKETQINVPGVIEESLEKYRILKYSLSDLEMAIPTNPFAGYFFDNEIEKYVKEVEFWLKSERYFEEINVPFKRGWTLHSIAGCGKTSLVRAIGQKFDLPIVILDLATMNNHDLARNWREALSHAPCIILFEDFDSQFNGRKNIANEKGISFDALLNCIAGIENINGIFTILTTNNIKKLDSALVRPGRCGDRIIELKPMNIEQRNKLAQHILKDCPQFIKSVLKNSEGETPAKFQQKCSDIALKYHWEKLKN